MRYKIRTWNNIFKGLLIASLFFLIFSAIPPTILSSVYVGLFCSAFNLLFIFYTRRLIKQGKGDELRP